MPIINSMADLHRMNAITCRQFALDKPNPALAAKWWRAAVIEMQRASDIYDSSPSGDESGGVENRRHAVTMRNTSGQLIPLRRAGQSRSQNRIMDGSLSRGSDRPALNIYDATPSDVEPE